MIYSFHADLHLRVGIVGSTTATYGQILGVGVVNIVCRPLVIGITHGLCVPRQVHWLLIHLGRQQVGQLLAINLDPDVSTLNGPTVNLQTLLLSKEYFIDWGVTVG